MKTIEITFGILPGLVRKMNLQEGTSIASLIKTLGWTSIQNNQLYINGIPQNDNYVLKEGDIALYIHKIKGEIQIKRNGIWIYHMYDKDDNFPSDFHAHNKELPEVLDIYTGNIYDKRTKKIVRKLSDKKLNYIRNQIEVNLRKSQNS